MEQITFGKNTISSEAHSEEVTDIIERMPTGWTKLVAGIASVFVVVVILLGWFIRYPDTVFGSITITGEHSPVRIVAPTSGRLHLLVSNNARVQVGNYLGFIENGACYEDVVRLDRICHRRMSFDVKLVLPIGLQLGSLSNPYNDFVLSYCQFDQLRKTKIYKNMRKALMEQSLSSVAQSVGIQHQIAINDEIQDGLTKLYQGDSVLHDIGALSDEAVSLSKNKLQESQKIGLNLRQSLMIRQAEGLVTDVEMAKLDIEACEKLQHAFYSMQSKHSILCNELRLWKERYFVTTPIEGYLEYLGFWRNGEFVQSSTELFSVIPAKNSIIGEMTISSSGAGKVAVGQEVNIQLSDYPYDEFGYVRGQVSKVSSIGQKVEGIEGITRAYLVCVSFPDKLKTNYGKRLTNVVELRGTGEIITRKRRLIERLFDNIQSINDK